MSYFFSYRKSSQVTAFSKFLSHNRLWICLKIALEEFYGSCHSLQPRRPRHFFGLFFAYCLTRLKVLAFILGIRRKKGSFCGQKIRKKAEIGYFDLEWQPHLPDFLAKIYRALRTDTGLSLFRKHSMNISLYSLETASDF